MPLNKETKPNNRYIRLTVSPADSHEYFYLKLLFSEKTN